MKTVRVKYKPRIMNTRLPHEDLIEEKYYELEEIKGAGIDTTHEYKYGGYKTQKKEAKS